ncbi:MAG: dihydropteroate synthase [Deltaproteobacteria bacterium]|nr:dihydropteroate synthase [Deltaproteobacteria bacterium]
MFTVIGERLNSSRPSILRAVVDKDEAFISEEAKKQEAAGATHIEVNVGLVAENEAADLAWVMDIVQRAVDLPLCIDSPNPKVLEDALVLANKPPIVNSISLEKNRLKPMLSFLRHNDCGVVALCMDDSGIPKTAKDVIERAGRLIQILEDAGIASDRIYVDPLIQPISTNVSSGAMVLEAVRQIRQSHSSVHILCGLSNISFGLPQRHAVNRAFLSLLMGAGLDAAILDPLGEKVCSVLKTTWMLLGKDPYCRDFLRAARRSLI